MRIVLSILFTLVAPMATMAETVLAPSGARMSFPRCESIIDPQTKMRECFSLTALDEDFFVTLEKEGVAPVRIGEVRKGRTIGAASAWLKLGYVPCWAWGENKKCHKNSVLNQVMVTLMVSPLTVDLSTR